MRAKANAVGQLLPLAQRKKGRSWSRSCRRT